MNRYMYSLYDYGVQLPSLFHSALENVSARTKREGDVSGVRGKVGGSNLVTKFASISFAGGPSPRTSRIN